MILIFVLKLVVSMIIVTWPTWVVVDDYLEWRQGWKPRDWSLGDTLILSVMVSLAVMAIWTRWP